MDPGTIPQPADHVVGILLLARLMAYTLVAMGLLRSHRHPLLRSILVAFVVQVAGVVTAIPFLSSQYADTGTSGAWMLRSEYLFIVIARFILWFTVLVAICRRPRPNLRQITLRAVIGCGVGLLLDAVSRPFGLFFAIECPYAVWE
jgi:hypothetical protein